LSFKAACPSRSFRVSSEVILPREIQTLLEKVRDGAVSPVSTAISDRDSYANS
jgi:hypothetical protein